MKITADFDGTVRSYTGEPIEKIIKLIKQDIANGDDVSIVTRRDPSETHRGLDGNGVRQWVYDNIGDVPVIFTAGAFKFKKLQAMGVDMHYEDDPAEIDMLKTFTDIQVVQVTADKTKERSDAMDHWDAVFEEFKKKKYYGKTVCVFDHGLFVSVAKKLSESFGCTYYVTSWESSFPMSNDTAVGEGMPGIIRTDDIFDKLDEIDLFVFTDIYHGPLQVYLQSIGKRVWGARNGDQMETKRYEFIQEMQKLGMNVPPTENIRGIDNLRKYLKNNDNKFVKVDSIFRGDLETFHHVNYDMTCPILDKMAYEVGPRGDSICFVVQDGIDAVVETGYDGYCIDGQFPDKCLVGIEVKDKAYVGQVMDYSDIPEQVREINDKLVPLFKKYGYRGMFSSEVRITEDGTAYLIDMTCRFPSPPTSTMLCMLDNLAEIVYEGADGKMVQPEFNSKYGAEAIGTCEFARDGFAQLFYEDEDEDYVMQPNSMMQEGKTYSVPQKYDMEIICNVVATGDDLDQTISDLNDRCSRVMGNKLNLDASVLEDAVEELKNI